MTARGIELAIREATLKQGGELTTRTWTLIHEKEDATGPLFVRLTRFLADSLLKNGRLLSELSLF